MSPRTHDVVICGAGITGISAAYYLALAGVTDVLIVDERPPLDLTSSRSTECYRNWWPDPEMLALMNRSIDLLEGLADASGNIFGLNRRGYLFVTADAASVPAMRAQALRISELGAGPVRIHSGNDSGYEPARSEGYAGSPPGADLLLSPSSILKFYPYLNESALAALHVRRAGWLSAQQLGMHLLDQARRLGVGFESARVTGVDVVRGKLHSIRLGNGETIETGILVDAAGPYIKELAALAGIDLPVYAELHQKVAFKDALGAIDRDAPLLIWNDAQTLPWNADERAALADDPETRWLTGSFPAGVHARPEGGPNSQMALALWEYKTQIVAPQWPPVLDGQYPEVALRGLGTMLPALKQYFGRLPRPQLDGGYYTRTRENRPLVGPTQVQGLHVCGAVSGYGIMSACGVGELLAAHVAGLPLPSYAAACALERYASAKYLEQLEHWEDSGQL